VRGQCRGDRDVQITQAAAATGHPGERRDEPGVPRHDLQDQVREIDPEEHGLQAPAQIDEARRVRDSVDLVGVQSPLSVDMHLRAGDEAVGQRSPGAVELPGMLGEQLAGILGKPERVQRRTPGGVPRRPREQLRARIAPARRRAGVDVTAQQMTVKLLEHAEHVRRLIDGAVGATLAVHQAPPPSGRDRVVGDAASVEIAGRGRRRRTGIQERGQVCHRLEHAGGLRRRAELDRLAEQRHECAHRREAVDKRRAPLAVGIGIGRRSDLEQVRDGGAQLRARHLALDLLPHQIQRQLLLVLERVQQHADGGRELAGVLRQPRVTTQLLLARLPRRARHQVVGHQHVKQLQGVIDGLGLQRAYGRDERRESPRLRMATQRRRLRCHAVACERDHASMRDRSDVKGTQPQTGDVGYAVQCPDHPGARRDGLGLAHPVKLRAPRALGHGQQPAQQPRLPTAHRLPELGPDAQRRGVTLARDKPGERRDRWQQHLALAQPANRAVEHRHRALARRPCAVIDPDSELGLGIGEVPVADLARDLPLMLQAGLLALRVRRHAHRGDAELLGDVLDHPARHLNRIGNEPAEAHRGQLHREAQPVVIATATTNQAPILVVEEEEALQMHPRRQPAKAPVRASLLIREELDRHAFSTYRSAP
jgi:hypothetical protein